MSNWDDDDFLGGGEDSFPTTSGNTGGAWDDDDFMGGGDSSAAAVAGDSWETDDWEKSSEPQKDKGPSKKTIKQIAKEKEAQEKAEKLKREKQIQDDKIRLENDPEYRRQQRDLQKKAQEESELESISDLFGPSASAPVGKQVFRQEANPERARELAAMSGLGDGAGGFDDDVVVKTIDQVGKDWDDIAHVQREGPAPGSLDQLPFATDADIIKFSQVLAAKVKGAGMAKTTNNAQTFSKVLLVELVRALGPEMKSQDVDEVLRVGTVVKNDLTKKTQNVNKNKKKKGIKLHDNGRNYSDEEFM